MLARDLYDLLFDADRDAADMDLDRVAYLVESMPGIDWIKELIAQDMPRLAPLLQPPAPPLEKSAAQLLCIDNACKDGYTGRVAKYLIHADGNSVHADEVQRLSAHRAARQGKPPVVDTTSDTIAQRIYDLIVALNDAETDDHVRRLAMGLTYFQPDVLDVHTLVQDSPRLKGEIARESSDSGLFSMQNGQIVTDHRGFVIGLEGLAQFVASSRIGIFSDVAKLLLQLFEQCGATPQIDAETLNRLRAEKKLPAALTVERRLRPDQSTYLYVWMIEDNRRDGQSMVLSANLADSAKNWDRSLVQSKVQPCVVEGEKLLKLVVVIGYNVCHAAQLAEADSVSWEKYSRGHLSQQLEARAARHVILLDEGRERARVVFNWGQQEYWTSGVSSLRYDYYRSGW